MIITFASFKGGVGKTTSSIHLACYLAKKGEAILIDGDRNKSATHWGKRGKLPFQVIDPQGCIVRLSPADDFTIIPFGDRRCPKLPD